MTVKQAILSFPGLSDIQDNFIEKVMVDRALVGSTTYTSSLSASVALCAADCYMHMINSPDISEGDLSIKLSRGAMKASAKRLYRENGEPEKAQKLEVSGTSRTDRW
jgi:hypothetical protein